MLRVYKPRNLLFDLMIGISRGLARVAILLIE